MSKVRNAVIGGSLGFLAGITVFRGMWPITTVIMGGFGYLMGNTEGEESRMRDYQRRYKKGMGGV